MLCVCLYVYDECISPLGKVYRYSRKQGRTCRLSELNNVGASFRESKGKCTQSYNIKTGEKVARKMIKERNTVRVAYRNVALYTLGEGENPCACGDSVIYECGKRRCEDILQVRKDCGTDVNVHVHFGRGKYRLSKVNE